MLINVIEFKWNFIGVFEKCESFVCVRINVNFFDFDIYVFQVCFFFSYVLYFECEMV